MIAKEIIYLDNNSTTKIDPRVFESMVPFLTDKFGNYSSKHFFGYQAKSAVDLAREQIAKLISANPDEIIFTSGATESINLAHIGFAIANQNKGKHIISSMVEHSACFESLQFLSKAGFEITYLKPDVFGRVNPDDLSKSLRKDTILVSLIFANNEIGTINNIEKISEICYNENIAFHTDATQAVGKLKINVHKLKISLLSFTAHKIYGPKGIGALFINKSKEVKLSPIILGGNQEYSLRAGTLNVPAIIGFGKACDILFNEMDNDLFHYKSLYDFILETFTSKLDNIKLNGHPTERLMNNLNFSVKNIKANDLILKTPDIAFSTGSTCSSEENKKSRVLKAIDLTDEEIDSTFRIGLGRFNTLDEVKYATNKLIDNINLLRNKSF